MGAPKQKWTSEEEEALRAGVDKHGAGKWRTIQKDPEFSHCLATRSNIDLKDKWRNMSVSFSGQGSREKSRTPKPKALPPVPVSSSGPPALTLPKDDGVSVALDVTGNSQDGKIPGYSALIIEALTVLKEPNASEIEIGAICSYIEGQKGYRLKDSTSATKTPTPKQKDPSQRSRVVQSSSNSADSVGEAADTIAYKIAESEAKSFLASEAVKEAERIASMHEEAQSLLKLTEEIYERCLRGEVVTLA
ncbi:uncharacterized protein A4U43_C05F20430 [Asparagus officinalis]|uniref:Uncharacterized protein n=1 Tax=Asparagus officinalis TaxID=4686 RepID=A0A5P1ETS4_ASPOF|nr:uncharacterized protein A4U43_C05F20430 [Asparagus officinalis]